MRTGLILILALGLVGAAAARQNPPARAIAPAAARAPVAVQLDEQAVTQGQLNQLRGQVQSVQGEVKALQGEVKTLQSQVADLNARTVTYQCTGQGTGRSSKGVDFDCGPYICHPAYGQCRTLCVSSADCISGYTCDTTSQRCTTR